MSAWVRQSHPEKSKAGPNGGRSPSNLRVNKPLPYDGDTWERPNSPRSRLCGFARGGWFAVRCGAEWRKEPFESQGKQAPPLRRKTATAKNQQRRGRNADPSSRQDDNKGKGPNGGRDCPFCVRVNKARPYVPELCCGVVESDSRWSTCRWAWQHFSRSTVRRGFHIL